MTTMEPTGYDPPDPIMQSAKSPLNSAFYHLYADLHSVDTGTSSSGDGMMTPTSSCFETRLGAKHKNAVPRPGKIYRIRLMGTDKVIMVVKGKVVLQPIAEAKLGGGWHWHCVETRNWLKFRNHVSGNYLGCSRFLDSIQVVQQEYRTAAQDYFCVRHHPDGGYLLLVNYTQDQKLPKLLQIGYTPGETSLTGMLEGGAQWVFEEV